jgi:hypothetical protein
MGLVYWCSLKPYTTQANALQRFLVRDFGKEIDVGFGTPQMSELPKFFMKLYD